MLGMWAGEVKLNRQAGSDQVVTGRVTEAESHTMQDFK